MSRVASIAPLHLHAGGSSSQQQQHHAPPAPVRRTGATGKSLGPRKLHAPAAASSAAASAGRYQLSMSQTSSSSGSITGYFSKAASAGGAPSKPSAAAAAAAAAAPRKPLADRSNTPLPLPLPQAPVPPRELSNDGSPLCSPAPTPPVHRALFGSGGADSGDDSSLPSCTPPNAAATAVFPVFAGVNSGSSSGGDAAGEWDPTPPDAPAAASFPLHAAAWAASAASSNIAAAPMKAPRKPARPPAAASAAASSASLSLRPEIIHLEDSLDGFESSSSFRPAPPNFSSQPSTTDPSPAASQDQEDARMDDGPSEQTSAQQQQQQQLQPLSRSASMCSDVVIEASQEDEDEPDAAVSAAPVASPLLNARSSFSSLASTPVHNTPIAAAHAPATDFSLFNESISHNAATAAAASSASSSSYAAHVAAAAAPPSMSTHRPLFHPSPAFSLSQQVAQQHQFAEMPPPSGSPLFAAKAAGVHGLVRAASRTGSMSYAHVAAAAQRSGSFVAGSQQQSALPPPVPRLNSAHVPAAAAASQHQQPLSQSNPQFHQTHLPFTRTVSSSSSSSNNPLQLSQTDRSNSFSRFAPGGAAAGLAFSSQSSQMGTQNSSNANNEGAGHSLESCNSFYCTPQDQPVRERTLGEISEELHLQREGVQVQNMLHQIHNPQQHQPVINTHMALAAAGRHGSGGGSGCGGSNSGSGLCPPPPIKKARLARNNAAAGQRGPLESMQMLGNTLPPASSSSEDQLSQQMTQPAAGSAPLPSAALASYANHSTTNALLARPGAPLTLENPFLAAVAPPGRSAPASASGGGAGASGAQQLMSRPGGSKKRGFGGGSATDSSSSSSSSMPQQQLAGALSPSSYLLNNFEYIRQFGIGSFGMVLLLRHRLDGIVYAVKKSKGFLRGSNSTKLLAREAHILAFLNSRADCPRSILAYKNMWVEEAHLYIQTEYCEGGSLGEILRKPGGSGQLKSTARGGTGPGGRGAMGRKEHSNGTFLPPAGEVALLSPLRACSPSEADPAAVSASSSSSSSSPFPESELLLICLAVSQALAFMHCHKLVHLDVKPDNILHAGEGQYRLADFGLACRSDSEGAESILGVGDKRYLAPEALEESIANLEPLDSFALGCTLYELASGTPFGLPMSHTAMHRLRCGDIEDIAPPRVSGQLYELIRQLLHPDPLQRRTPKECVEIVEEIIAQQQ